MAIDQEPIANLITRYALIEKLYINEILGSLDEAEEAIKDKIVALYTAIILDQLATYRFWKQGKITQGIESLVTHKLKLLSSSIRKKEEDVESALHGSDRKVLLKILETVQEPITQIGDQLQQVLNVVMNLGDEKYSEVLSWVSPILHLDHHREYKPIKNWGMDP